MARSSEKKLAAQNARTMSSLWRGFLIVNAIYLLYRVWYHYATFSWWLVAMYAASCGISVLLLRQLNAMATATFDESGLIVDGGQDLAQEGITSYMFDVIYVTWFVHLSTALVSDLFWWLYLVIPAFALYKIVMLVRSTGLLGGGQDPPGPPEPLSKTQLKKQKRAEAGEPTAKYRR